MQSLAFQGPFERVAARLAALPWRSPVFAGAVVVGVLFFGWSLIQLRNHLSWLLAGTPDADWYVHEAIDPANPYATRAGLYSVPYVWLWHTFVLPLGLGLWRLLHLAALLLVRDRLVIVAALLTFPFWADVMNGNNVTFVFVLAWFALRGNRAAVIAFCVLAALQPRPLLIPVLATLMWRRWDARLTFAAAAALVLGVALATGTLDDWIARLQAEPAFAMAQDYNKGPSRVIGAAWIPIGIVLAGVALWRGWVGLSSVLISPYLIHYYLMMLLLDLPRLRSMIARIDRERLSPLTRRTKLWLAAVALIGALGLAYLALLVVR